MKLEEYLQNLKECPDELLQDELGVSDNFPILYRYDFQKMIELFQNGNWRLTGVDQRRFTEQLRERALYLKEVPIEEQTRGWTFGFNFITSHVVAEISDKTYPHFSYPIVTENEEFKTELERLGFNGSIMLHPYNHRLCQLSKRTKDSDKLRDIGNAIKDICGKAIQLRIPICIYKIGCNYRESDSALDRIVYFNPNGES